MKILLINPGSPFLIDDMAFPSLGLLYISAYLKKHGYNDIELLDLSGNRKIPDKIDAEIIGFYSNTPQYPIVIKLLQEVKERNKNKKSLYVIGGPHVSGRPSDSIEYFDITVIGEGEAAMLEIVKALEGKKAINSKIIRKDYIKDIDTIPFPDRDIFNIRGYKYFIDGHPTTTLITSRGCPFSCTFCANNSWGKKIRMRSPENVYEEVALIKDKYGYDSFMFFDDTMTLNKKRMKNICELLKPLRITYRCFIRGDTVNEEILGAMKDSGCVEVGIGVESGSQVILDGVKKGEKIETIMYAINLSKRAGLRVKGFFVVGLPGEARGTVQETINFLDRADLDDFDITVFSPYPGSELYKSKGKYDITFTDDYENAWFKGRRGDYKTCVSTSSLSSKEILELRDYIEDRFKKKKLNNLKKRLNSH